MWHTTFSVTFLLAQGQRFGFGRPNQASDRFLLFGHLYYYFFFPRFLFIFVSFCFILFFYFFFVSFSFLPFHDFVSVTSLSFRMNERVYSCVDSLTSKWVTCAILIFAVNTSQIRTLALDFFLFLLLDFSLSRLKSLLILFYKIFV